MTNSYYEERKQTTKGDRTQEKVLTYCNFFIFFFLHLHSTDREGETVRHNCISCTDQVVNVTIRGRGQFKYAEADTLV